MNSTSTASHFSSRDFDAIPPPPRMHVALCLFLVVITFGLFNMYWGFKIFGWVKRIDPRSKAATWWIFYVIFGVIFTGGKIILFASNDPGGFPLLGFFSLFSLVFGWIGVFSARSSLLRYCNREDQITSPVGIGLAFAFNTIYLQFKLNKIAETRFAAVTTAYATPSQPYPGQRHSQPPPSQSSGPNASQTSSFDAQFESTIVKCPSCGQSMRLPGGKRGKARCVNCKALSDFVT